MRPLGGIIGGLRDRLLGSHELASPRARLRALRWGGAALRAQAARAWGAADPAQARADTLVAWLSDPAPGVRRAVAWALGQLPGSPAALLLDAARAERMDEVRLAMAVAAVRCGAAPAQAWEPVAVAAGRRLRTCDGWRSPAAALGLGPSELARRWTDALSPGTSEANPASLVPQPPAAARARLRAALRADPTDGQALLELAAQQHPEDHSLICDAAASSGRRAGHLRVVALGIHGDPRSLEPLLSVLRAVDVDPGAGFAGRARAARALGQLGLPEAAPALIRALEDEAADQEGRPGAGLGVQVPVRVDLLVALGECGAVAAAPVLATYLGAVSASAKGGLHLPAMDALCKLGAAAAVEPLLAGPELAAANALGVLGALGLTRRAEAFREDTRPAVSSVARAICAEGR